MRLFTTGEVARLLGVKQHRITYAITSGYLHDTKVQFAGKRCFDNNDVKKIAAYFGVHFQRGGDDHVSL